MFVPNFKILSQVVSEKSLTEKKFTDRQTDRQTNKHPYGKGKNYIPPIYFVYRGSYTGGIMNNYVLPFFHQNMHYIGIDHSVSLLLEDERSGGYLKRVQKYLSIFFHLVCIFWVHIVIELIYFTRRSKWIPKT